MMFSLFNADPIEELRKRYEVKLEQALLAQKQGNTRAYLRISAEAEKIWREIVKIRHQDTA